MALDDEETTRITLRIETSLQKDCRHAIYHHNEDDFHSYIRMLIRRDIKKLKVKGIIQ